MTLLNLNKMLVNKLPISKTCLQCFCQRFRFVQTTCFNYLDQRWREAKGLPKNPNASGVLTDSADYTYLDGRPVPYGTRQKNRILKQKQITETVMKLSGEIDFAIERHSQMQSDTEERKQRIISSKLKPKGISLLRKS